MKISQTIKPLRKIVSQWCTEGQKIGFVPTMGHLHKGHLQLVKQARLSCDKVVVSIFVNPMQFNQQADFDAYPVTLEEDKDKLISMGTDLLFLPDIKTIYPHGENMATRVCVSEITKELEGEHRPGHFDGVSTVVNKLFNIVQPQMAFFGEKDYQQLLLVDKMVADLNMPIEIHSVITCREDDGLAMSSRNSRLSKSQRDLAPELYKVLQKVSLRLTSSDSSIAEIEFEAKKQLDQCGFETQYIAIRDRFSLKIPSPGAENRLVLGAVKLGDIRLIDNLIID